jgi:hypothetical protein
VPEEEVFKFNLANFRLVLLNLSLMKSLIKTSGKKLSKKDYIFASVVLFLVFIILLLSMVILVLRSTGIKLNAQNRELGGKVSSLQNDLKDIGQRLSGLSNEETEDETVEARPLERIGLVASPGETSLVLDVPEGWSLLGDNRLVAEGATVFAQSEDIDFLTLSNYKVTRLVEPVNLKSGQTAFIVFIQSSSENRGYLSLSFCNPEVGEACSFKGRDAKFVFILAHGFERDDAFVRDMDFNSADGIKLLTDFRVMVQSLEIS